MLRFSADGLSVAVSVPEPAVSNGISNLRADLEDLAIRAGATLGVRALCLDMTGKRRRLRTT